MLVTVFSIIYNLPRFFEYTVTTVYSPRTYEPVLRSIITSLGQTELYQVMYGQVLYTLIMFVVPLITLVILNFKLIHHKVKSKKDQLLTKSQNTGNRYEDDITLILIVIVTFFIVTHTPGVITQILFSLLDTAKLHCPQPFFFFERISDLLLVAYSSLKFIIYCSCSKNFRQILSRKHGAQTLQAI